MVLAACLLYKASVIQLVVLERKIKKGNAEKLSEHAGTV
jgi:hypothetical protein